MLQRLTNYNNIRKINCRPSNHDVPPASLMARPNMPTNHMRLESSSATSTPYSIRSLKNFESDFNSSSTSISDISSSDETELEQTTIIRRSPIGTEIMNKNKPQIINNLPVKSNEQPVIAKKDYPVNPPKILKSSCISKKVDQTSSRPTCTDETKMSKEVPKSTEIKKIRFNIPPKISHPSNVQSRASKIEVGTSLNARESRKAVPENQDDLVQLLHPGWRSVPWKDYFGWTEGHQALMKKLKNENTKGESIYYRNEEEHEAARASWESKGHSAKFLGGPTVTSVLEMMEVIKQNLERGPFSYVPKSSPRRRREERSGYDSDSD